jgi:putative tricarboxylic transport membrane protein
VSQALASTGRRGNVVLGLVAVFGGVVYLVADLHLPQPAIGDPNGPKLFPGFIGAGLVLSGVLLCFEKPADREHAGMPAGSTKVLAAMTVWTMGYDLLFEKLGYLLATSLYVLPMLCVFNRGRWVTNLLVAVLFTLGAFVVFDKVLGSTLPPGLLSF